MSTSSETILAFVDLAITRRRRALAPEDRAKIEGLDQQLRDLIDGARPAPRSIDGRVASPSQAAATPAAPTPPPVAPSAPSAPAAAAAAGAKRGANVKALAERLEISSTDKKKLTDVRAEDLPVSQYTPSTAPAYLSDYYSDDIVFFSPSSDLRPEKLMRADESDLDVPREVKVLFGLEQPAPVRVPQNDATGPMEPKKRIVAPTAAARMQLDANAQAASSNRQPVIIHLLAGGTRRGAIEAFEPGSGAIDFFDDNGARGAIELADVLAVFFVQKKGEEASAPTGQRVIVRLVNDRQVAGLTEDYAEGGDSLTLTPEQRRGNVDRVWIPAWAVKEIHLG